MEKSSFKQVEEMIELGKFYFINQKFDQAIKEFRRAIEKEPSNIDAYYNIAVAYEAINDNEKAKKFYEKVLELKPDHKLAREHIDKITGG